MNKNFIVDEDGRVFMPVSKDIAKAIFKKDPEKKIFMFFSTGCSDIVIDKKQLKRHDGQFGVLTGQIREFIFKRKEFFTDLESIERYYVSKKRMPWGIKSMITYQGWTSEKVSGYRYVIRDDARNKELRVSFYGDVEMVDLEPNF